MTAKAWPEVALGDVCALNPPLGRRLDLEEVVEFVPMAAVEAATGRVTTYERRSPSELTAGLTPFVSGDVLVAKITPCFQNGKIALAAPTAQVAYGSTEFHVVRAVDGVIHDRYLFHFLRQDWIREAGERRMTGSGGQRRVPAAFLGQLQIPAPPIEEQRRIAAVLDKAEELRAKHRAARALLDTLTESIFLDMFGDPATNPSGWPSSPLAEVVQPGTIVTYGIVQAGDEFPGGVPYVRTGDLDCGEIRIDGLRHTDPAIASKFNRSRVQPDEIIMSIRATVGTTALVPKVLAGANLTQGTARIAPGPQTTPAYLLAHLRSGGTQRWIQRQVKGATFREITLSRLRELPVVLAPLGLQHEFAKRVALATDQRVASIKSGTALDGLFASLQQRAFRGEL